MSDKQIISYNISVPNSVEGVTQFALYEIIDGRVVLTRCDHDGNPVERLMTPYAASVAQAALKAQDK